MNSMSKLKSLPLGALVVLIVMGGAFVVGASLVWVGLTVPADGTVVDTPVETAYFSSSVTPFHFGSLALANSSSVVTFTVTNESTTTRTLHIYASNVTDPEVSLVITLSNGTPYTPTSLTAGSSITLKAHLEATAEATPGPVSLIVHMD